MSCHKSQPIPFVKLSAILNHAPKRKRLFVLLKFYADESYNNRTFNFGGWLAKESAWIPIEKAWKNRIDYERRKHGRFDRYHATDCSSSYGDYKNWTKEQTLQHVKKLLGIITRKPRDVVAICFGLDMEATIRIFSGHKRDPNKGAYNLCTRKLMHLVYQAVIQEYGAGYRVAIIHDHTQGYDGVILDAFNCMMDDPMVPHYKEMFTTIVPMRWQDCTLLQPADMIAFDTFKLVDGSVHRSTEHMRKSLRALMRKGVRLAAHYFGEDEIIQLQSDH
jgi:hypothetical protein